jgi:hypothetical protein
MTTYASALQTFVMGWSALDAYVQARTAETPGEQLGIAELAARAHLGAAANRIPGRVGPLNRRAVARRGLVDALSVTAVSGLEAKRDYHIVAFRLAIGIDQFT